MIRAFLPVIVFFMGIHLALAEAGPRIEVFEHGTYTAASPSDIVVGFTHRGLEIGDFEEIDHVQSTRVVVGQLGNKFGFRYRVSGLPSGMPMRLTIVLKFPPPGMVAKPPSAPFLQDDYVVVEIADSDAYWTWTFDDRAQIIPGTWVIEIWNGSKKLTAQEFTVILPPIA